MDSHVSSHLAATGILSLAAGAGYIGSSLFTDHFIDQALAAGTTAALSTLFLRSSDQVTVHPIRT
jgi:hypothetical protein